MELKYYLRGLGLGIVITAVIMGVALSGQKSMKDEEIVARAKELGMVENTVLADTTDSEGGREDGAQPDEAEIQKNDAEQTPPEDDTLSEAAENTDGGAGTGDAGQDGSTAGTETAGAEEPEEAVPGDQYATPGPPQGEFSPAAAEDASEDMAAGGADEQEPLADAAGVERVITIDRGDGSYTVAKKLAEAGVVTSAENFDTFLCANGYDKKLRTGEFSIPADASDEQIARIVTGAE